MGTRVSKKIRDRRTKKEIDWIIETYREEIACGQRRVLEVKMQSQSQAQKAEKEIRMLQRERETAPD